MGEPIRDIAIDPTGFDQQGPVPIFQQLYRQIRDQIATGVLRSGSRLPSTRALAADLGLSRTTTIAAFEQLETEGYIETRKGARARVLPLPFAGDGRDPEPLPQLQDNLSRRGQALVTSRHETGVRGNHSLQPGLPDAGSFPFTIWRRLLSKHMRPKAGETFGYHSYGGHEGLREVIAQYMQSSRGVKCQPDQIMVTSGAQSAFTLLAHLLIDAGDPVMIEEPGYTGAHGAFVAAGARIEPLTVSGRNWDLKAIAASRPKLIYLTPSCQFPLGSTMRIEQRLRLLQHAAATGAWVIEDDFDSEFRFSGNRVPTLQSQDTDHRTIYVGSFAKTMLPDLRLGFIIFPGEVVRPVRKANFLMGTAASLVTQAALADFIRNGDFARHTRRMKRLYAARRAMLVKRAHTLLGDVMEQVDEGNGLQTSWRFLREADDVLIVRRALEAGVCITPLSVHYIHGKPEQGLMIGYAATEEKQIPRAMNKLNQVIRQHLG
ncbi:MAG: PLP-dependent aminotransferase family protein [Rhizobiaceae bacterium]|nr:PLP-dependent aminotransferase family protein [Rhizobiaceae bacterium]